MFIVHDVPLSHFGLYLDYIRDILSLPLKQTKNEEEEETHVFIFPVEFFFQHQNIQTQYLSFCWVVKWYTNEFVKEKKIFEHDMTK